MKTTRTNNLGLRGIILIGILTLAACQGTSTAEPTPMPTGEDAPTQEGRQGVLRVSAFPIGQTDPARISSDSEVLIANHVYDYPVDVDADNDIQPRLATA